MTQMQIRYSARAVRASASDRPRDQSTPLGASSDMPLSRLACLGARLLSGCAATSSTLGEATTRRAALATTFGALVVAGCGASGSASAIDRDGGGDPSVAPEDENEIPLPSNKDHDDASQPTVGKDAGPPRPQSGDPCNAEGDVFERPCGVCGKQSAECVDDGGSLRWSAYSKCGGEIAGGCVPGTTVSEPCGDCGTRVRTCLDSCTFSNAQCKGQPLGHCTPGSIDLRSAGCAAPGTYRARACKADCSYDSYGACAAPPTSVLVAPTLGGVSSTIVAFKPTKTMPLLFGVCPNAAADGSIDTPFEYVQVKNTLAKAAKLTIWNSVSPGGVQLDTKLVAYAGAVAPTTAPARASCIASSAFGHPLLTGEVLTASLDLQNAVTVPAGGTVTVYVAMDVSFDANNPAHANGLVKLNVRTEAFE